VNRTALHLRLVNAIPAILAAKRVESWRQPKRQVESQTESGCFGSDFGGFLDQIPHATRRGAIPSSPVLINKLHGGPNVGL
jgi:hypothetical protein